MTGTIRGNGRRRLALVAALAILFAAKRRLGRGPVVATLVFVATLFPALGFFNTYPMRYSFVADHFQYLACGAFIALIVTILMKLRLPRAAIALSLPILGTLTWMQTRIYASDERIWEDTIAKIPFRGLPATISGRFARPRQTRTLRAGRRDAAMSKLTEALWLFDEVKHLRPGHEKLAFNRAEVLRKMGRFDEAMSIYQQQLNTDPRSAG